MLPPVSSAPPFDPSLSPPDAGSRPGPAGGGAPSRGASAVAQVSAARAASGDPLSFQGLSACVADARGAVLRDARPPSAPEEHGPLRARLEKACAKLPPEYRRAVGEPLLATLDRLGPRGFERVLASDPDRVGEARLLLDVCEAVLQRAEGYQPEATAAFQEVVSDLYGGFLSAEARKGVKPPEHGATPPLVRWGADEGPSTWPVTASEVLRVHAGVVTLPAANATGGLLAWPALAHEAAGHDILDADDGLRDELGRSLRTQLLSAKMGPALADYWADRVEETAADVLGVLNMGPAAAVGLVGYFRAMNGAFGGTPSLRNVGRSDDPHPADIARVYVAAETVRLLSFRGAAQWADRLEAEADRDLGLIRLGDTPVTAGVAKACAAVVARAIVRTRLASLEGRALGDIQDWRDRDEAIVASLRGALREPRVGVGEGAGRWETGAYAAHAVAAGVYEALGGGTPPREVMGRMVGVLDAMHAHNPEWAAGATPVRTGARPSPTSGS